MRLDNKYDKYNRKIYSILEFLGDMGGLFRALFSIGMVIVGQFAQRLFFSDMLHSIYQIRKKSFDSDDEEFKHKDIKAKDKENKPKTLGEKIKCLTKKKDFDDIE